MSFVIVSCKLLVVINCKDIGLMIVYGFVFRYSLFKR